MRAKRSVRKDASGGGGEARSAARRGRVVMEVAFEVGVMVGAEVRLVANRGVGGVAVGGVGTGCVGATAAAAAQVL